MFVFISLKASENVLIFSINSSIKCYLNHIETTWRLQCFVMLPTYRSEIFLNGVALLSDAVFNGKLNMRQTHKIIFSDKEQKTVLFFFGMAINNNEKWILMDMDPCTYLPSFSCVICKSFDFNLTEIKEDGKKKC